MLKSHKKLAALLLSATLLMSSFVGCDKKTEEKVNSKEDSKQTQQTATSEVKTEEVKSDELIPGLSTAKDSSDLPDWTGKQLKLKVWYAHGSGGDARKTSTQDVFRAEVKRVTGIELDPEGSFDNSGQTGEQKLAMIIASKDFPDIVYNVPDISKVVRGDLLYDLTDLVEKYCPDIIKALPADKLPGLWDQPGINGGIEGKIYGLPMRVDPKWFNILDPDFAKENEIPFGDNTPFLWVREDILKKIYPQAKTVQEIEELYVQRGGKFTKEDLYDVPLNSREDVIQFFYEIKKLGIKEDGKDVEPLFLFSGGDNWPLMSVLTGGLYGWFPENNYFTYWDNITKKVEYMFKQPFFKEALHTWNKLVRDGIVPKECFIDNAAAFNQKRDTGMYATSYAWLAPDRAKLESAGKPVYRRVYFNFKGDTEGRFVQMTGAAGSGSHTYYIFKDSVKEEDVPQILTYFNYLWTEAGMKASVWGPRSAGLFTEDANGKRKYVDKDLEDCMAYGKANEKGLYYGIANFYNTSLISWPWIVRPDLNKFRADFMYDKEVKASDGFNKFNQYTGIVDPIKRVESLPCAIWNFPELEGVKKQTASRKTFEDAMLKVLAATSEEEFEKLYDEFIKIAETTCGMDDKLLEEINREYSENYNKEYMKNLLK